MDKQTRRILDIFEKIDSIPRCSKHEERISRWLQEWAEDQGLDHSADQWGNVVMRIPPSPGFEKSPAVVIQGHMDMVCEKAADSGHDFSKDPIRFVYEGDWLKADRTTLGADNGIAIAMALALAGDATLAHPALELLFTVDEEQGLTGANKLCGDFIRGRILLNLDSEEEGVLTVGCSGGRETRITLPVEFSELPGGFLSRRITVGGLKGGHSGVDIHRHRASANKLLARLLEALSRAFDIRLVSIQGGSAHNAIPRDSEAVIALSPANEESLQKIVAGFEQTARNEHTASESSIAIRVSGSGDTADRSIQALSAADTVKAIRLMLVIPHGVLGMSAEVEDLVETSNNFAVISTQKDSLRLLTSQRSSVMSRLDSVTAEIEALAHLAGAATETGSDYPSWPANMSSPLLARCRNVYRDLYGKEPAVNIMHAGLECAVLGARFPDMDMISFGPTILNPHSPDEKILLPAIAGVWKYLVELLRSFSI